MTAIYVITKYITVIVGFLIPGIGAGNIKYFRIGSIDLAVHFRSGRNFCDLNIRHPK